MIQVVSLRVPPPWFVTVGTESDTWGFFNVADCGDYVVAVGCAYLKITGDKRKKKKYYSHSTRPGHLQEITMDRMMRKFGGAEVLRRAVSGMLPKNRLREVRLARLRGLVPGTTVMLLVVTNCLLV